MHSDHQKQANLLTLPADQRRLLTHLLREGPTDLNGLATALGQEIAALQNSVSELIAQKLVEQEGDEYVAASLGRTRRRRLPARLWPALQTANRLYSTQEIVTLRTVVPMLQFARARLGELTDHGPGHVLRVKSFATQLGYAMGLTTIEQHVLRAAALFHDIGNVVDRATHHIISQQTVETLAANGQIPFSSREAALVGLLCRWHRKEYDPSRYDEFGGETVRTGFLASILRVADALDSDYRRVDYGDKFIKVLQIFYPKEIPFLQDLDSILGIRICCTPHIQLQVFVRPELAIEESYHLRALRKDVNETPLNYAIEVIRCGANTTPAPPSPVTTIDSPVALLVSPFEPHSLVMSALSRKHLLAAGYRVELLIYPDTAEASTWLWRGALAERNPGDFHHLLLINDRPDAAISATRQKEFARWQAAGTRLTLLNRHEANWAGLADLLDQSTADRLAVTLGGDWSYFWGDAVDEPDIFWGRIAALCTRDPVQSTVGSTAEEQTICQGLLKRVYDGMTSATRFALDDVDGWRDLATPILEQIALDQRSWFVEAAAAFQSTYASLPPPSKIVGKVLYFDLPASDTAHASFWGLEAAIEGQGRMAVRGICFQKPYAIATLLPPDPDVNGWVEVLAINHWREEEAIPIRLLFPTEWAVTPEGNESAIRVRLPAGQATQLVALLIEACNQA